MKKELSARDAELAKLRSQLSLSDDVNTLRAELAEAKAIAARLSGMYEQKSKDFRDSELERLTLLGKQILDDGAVPKETPPARPRPASRRGRQRSRSLGRDRTEPKPASVQNEPTPPSSQPFWQDEPLFTKHVAAVTTATMSALPHLPFEAAIASHLEPVPPPSYFGHSEHIPLVCLLAVVVLLLGPLLGPKLLLLVIVYSPFSLTPLSS